MDETIPPKIEDTNPSPVELLDEETILSRLSEYSFTTGEAATCCMVSQQIIIRCFDAGLLKGFRVPNSLFRKIPGDGLYRFIKENGIPKTALIKILYKKINNDRIRNGDEHAKKVEDTGEINRLQNEIRGLTQQNIALNERITKLLQSNDRKDTFISEVEQSLAGLDPDHHIDFHGA